MSTWAIIVAAGSGQRYGGEPKQFRNLWGKPVVAWSIEVARCVVDSVVVVLPKAYLNDYEAQLRRFGADIIVPGGTTRSESVRCGLKTLEGMGVEEVLIHDGARPLADRDLWIRVLNGLRGVGFSAYELPPAGVVPAVAITDTIKEVESSVVIRTIPRDNLYVVQTPQAFVFEALVKAHQSNVFGTDDAELLERTGQVIRVVQGSTNNIKLTYPEDFEIIRRLAVS